MANGTERLLSGFVAAFGAGIAAVAALALFGDPVSSTTVAAVRAVALLAAAAVAVGALFATAGRLPVQPVVPLAGAPAALAGATVAVSMGDAAAWLSVATGAATALGLVGLAVVAVTADDKA
ncbi:hypothetical protein [Halobacterium litoreum]|uniref:Integral membrane protein n=1 Tax=Halobacterium litoreum TaxID=2039234 RepID=A0ABD5NFT9_9EURY|nr:hypothetical protein [Halobacterium litoreum]UHH12940.1 hypothetical protein LT972_12335 [Halobacterium litoreum]